jgi:alanine racemase
MPERWAWVEVDLAAVRANVRWLRQVSAPAAVWAVVKANGYGHGAVTVARAALDAGAAGLAVALVEEGVELREAGLQAPILVLSEPPAPWMPVAVAHRLELIVYSPAGIAAAAEAAAAVAATPGHEPLAVHLKLDTGMRRVGAHPRDAVALAKQILDQPSLRLAAVATHLAVADDTSHPATPAQLASFAEALAALRDAGIDPPAVHAANSAGAIAHPAARYTLVRAGIAMYGLSPAPRMAELTAPLRPALSLKAKVSFVKHVAGGEQVSYGLRHTFTTGTTVATLPLGYADGVPRRLFQTGGQVLLGGQRCPIVGVVTMDQLMVDAGPAEALGPPVEVGDEAVLIGSQGGEEVSATEWAERLGTIGYEIVCGLSGRLPRRHLHVTELAREPPRTGR